MSLDVSMLMSGNFDPSIQAPSQPITREMLDLTKISMQAGDDPSQYNSFLDAVSSLSQMFKFMTPDDQSLYQQGLGAAFSNIDYNANANDWNLIGGVDTDATSVLDEVNNYFDWDTIKNVGSGQTYYDIATSGDVSSMTDEEAFDLMCSMLDSRERVYNVMTQIFGDMSDLNDNSTVIKNISDWLASYSNVDPHNISVLSMFFSAQSSFINSLDSYINCGSYWGSALTTPPSTLDLGTFSTDMMTKVDDYINSLSGDQKTAAQDLETQWDTPSLRWDSIMENGTVKWGTDLENTDGSWFKFFKDTMSAVTSKDVIRNVIAMTMNNSDTNQYNDKEKVYEDKKDDYMDNEAYLQKQSAKKAAENKKFLNTLVQKHSAANKLARSAKPKASTAKKPKNASTVQKAQAPKQQVHRAAQASAAMKAPRHNQNSNAAIIAAAQSRVARYSPSAARQQSQSSKKNEKKVV